MLYLSRNNTRYHTQFYGSNGQAWIESNYKVLFTDGRYEKQAREQTQVDEIIIYQNFTDALAEFLQKHQPEKVYYEAPAITLDLWHKLGKKIDLTNWESAPDSMVNCRVAKRPEEIEAIRKAVQIAEESYKAIEPRIKPGVSERDIALDLEWEIRKRGSRCIPFEFIVASGKRSALPHGVATDQPILEEAPLTLDFGAEWDGYFSDMTIAGSVGRKDAWTAEIVSVLEAAQQAAFSSIRPGIPVAEVDHAARQVINEAGYADAFKHGLGHGVGLDIHEAPRVSHLSDDILVENAVITIEPGIYVDGKGGARLEDMILVTADGCELLTTIPKKHIVWS